MAKVVILAMIGPPGSGKSYFAERYCQNHDFVHTNSDQVRMQFFPHPTFTVAERQQVYEKIFDIAEAKVRGGQNVVLDCNLETNAKRKLALRRFERFASSFFVVLSTSANLALERAVNRGYSSDKIYHPMTPERVKEMREDYEPMDADLPQIELHGDAPYEKSELMVDEFLAR